MRRGCVPALVLASSMLLAGCQSTKPTDTSSAVTRYEGGQYAAAKTQAEKRYKDAKGQEKEAAALTAGLSAYNMGQHADAERWLTPLTSSNDSDISGKSQVTLGLIAQKRNQHATAAKMLLAGADQLDGEEAIKARLAAARSLENAGQSQLAQAQYAQAATTRAVVSSSSTGTTSAGLATFTVQVGAFTTRANAQKRADAVRSAAARQGLGTPRVTPDTDRSGKPIFTVQIGQYQNKASAIDAMRRLGTEAVVTAQ